MKRIVVAVLALTVAGSVMAGNKWRLSKEAADLEVAGNKWRLSEDVRDEAYGDIRGTKLLEVAGYKWGLLNVA